MADDEGLLEATRGLSIALRVKGLSAAAEIVDGAAARIAELERALDELSEDHVPIWTSEAAKAAGKDPWVCQLCDVQDGSWPCTARMIIDDVRATGGAPGVSETHTDPKEAP